MSTASSDPHARPRGRRDQHTPVDDKQNLSRASSQRSQKFGNALSRTFDDILLTHTRSESMAPFWQRSKAVDLSRSDTITAVSPRTHGPPKKTSDQASTQVPAIPTNAARSLRERRSKEMTNVPKESIGPHLTELDLVVPTTMQPVKHEPETLAAVDPQTIELNLQSSETPASPSTTFHMQPTVSDPVDEETLLPSSADPYATPAPMAHTGNEAVFPHQTEPLHSVTQSFGSEVPTSSSSYQPPQMPTPTVSPPQTPSLYYQPIFSGPNLMPFQYPYGSTSMLTAPFTGHFYPNSYVPPLPPQPPTYSSDYTLFSCETKEEHQRVVENVTSVLPDISRLLQHHQNLRGELSAKDLLIRAIEQQHQHQLDSLRMELDAKKGEYDKIIDQLIAENHGLKESLKDKDETLVRLRNTITKQEASRLEPTSTDSHHGESTAPIKPTKTADEKCIRGNVAVEALTQDLLPDHDPKPDAAMDQHSVTLAAQSDDHRKALIEQKLALNKAQMELASLITKHSHLRKEFEASQKRVSGLEAQLRAEQKANEGPKHDPTPDHVYNQT